MPAANTDENGYSTVVGLIYVFNLIVGTGALTLPAAFAESGWALGLCLIIMLAFMSYLTATFVIEAMAAANAIIHWRRQRRVKRRAETPGGALASSSGSSPRGSVGDASPSSEELRLLEPDPVSLNEYYNITETVEMGKMASFFFSKWGVNVFYVMIALYLYGDLAIYAAAVAKSLRDVGCTYVPVNHTCNASIPLTERCWADLELTRWDAYRIFLSTFVVVLGSFVFFNVQKTKYLQILTTLMRWGAFGLMVVLALRKLAAADRPLGRPAVARVAGLPTLFGVCVYSFMCHHSLPSLITPITNKRRLSGLLAADYLLILGFYLLLAFTGIFAFPSIYDLYTLNFVPDDCDGHYTGWFERVLDYFLTLFPVFTLSTNFPIIAITLRNNLQTLCLTEGRRHGLFIRRLLFPVLALLPPSIVALVFQDLQMLVGVTGSYAGSGIQYVVPALLVLYSRRTTLTLIGMGVRNKHSSVFQHTGWIVFVLLWAAVCVVFVTVNHLQDWFGL
ncbi:transmembrane protein 104-like [Pollicipes pollicipes]|uniref:transmembrane protein 104-like n=1 Tax=Pollicipes pollicipes TaxID=41117 RepID=UPI0018851FA9|nr:transmembrane protein 104-like [Pollicipes pollicipes]XP_037091661.1 transmembrane protein 104-like [Pollicipes pollicipes]XP_037091662.1 transmembrane protein 104-like [Pollicipes pollicipes]XP_037091664.1 transmembrane protein 104-like [Pollicipes pollicipes]XP_037091665.1 transmembrane protein 104-like [Pollicipes pollicipes]